MRRQRQPAVGLGAQAFLLDAATDPAQALGRQCGEPVPQRIHVVSVFLRKQEGDGITGARFLPEWVLRAHARFLTSIKGVPLGPG